MNVNYGDKCKVDSDCPQMYATVYDQNKILREILFRYKFKAGRVCKVIQIVNQVNVKIL